MTHAIPAQRPASRARVQLLLIDPQNDFCDLPATWWGRDALSGEAVAPSLPVAGAHADMQRLAGWLRQHGAQLDAITVTLDSHQRIDIAHPGFWRTRSGDAVAPFTAITAAQVRSGEYRPVRDDDVSRVLAYLDQLEVQGRYTHMVWPVHCEVGRFGHGVHAALAEALADWQLARGQAVRHVFKGLNPWTEHYSAFLAEVPDAGDPATALNTRLLAELDAADCLIVAGEAGSHCVRASCEHLVQYLPSGRPERLVLLTDCMSPVAGFEAAQADFLQAMRAHGVRLATSTDDLSAVVTSM
ncbi:cysteine hydrolase [Comamonas serinivorans]|uniref:Cysteine hydrolase n=1 Tax=Comamonas serinivorans TaxID=1082851 RepID=A0A1Y0EQV3_9BURK|nr:cysteine hydrolase [Comamonas serinivorans]ARU06035.1 cysteine hydrolase [Comamonas serinivorans]